MKRIFLLALLCVPVLLSAQPKYWIYLKDKNLDNSPAVSQLTLETRQKFGLATDDTDLPVRADYQNQLQDISVKIANRSKWLNAVSAVLTSEQAQEVRQLDFVKEVVPMTSGFYIAQTKPVERAQMAQVMSQVQANAFQKAGINGKDVTIGVIDAGFYGADSSLSLQHIFSNKRILGIHDYVKPGRSGRVAFQYC